MRHAVIAEAMQAYGNHFVHTALARTQDGPTPPSPAPVSSGSGGSHVSPGSHAPKSPSHVSPGSHPDGGPPIGSQSTTKSQSVSFMEGEVYVKESVSITLSHGAGPLNFDISKGGLSVGTDHVNIDLKSAKAAQGKGLSVSGPATSPKELGKWKGSAKTEDGYLGYELGSSWTLSGKGADPWTVTIAISAFVGAPPKAPKPPDDSWYDVPVLSQVIEGVVAIGSALEIAAAAVVETAPEWGPILLAA